jgi:hypothetical protein
MADTRVAVFLLGRGSSDDVFVAWASLLGSQVALLHGPGKRLRSGARCSCAVYEGGVQTETIYGAVRRTQAVRSAPPFVFLEQSSAAPVSEPTDMRLYSTDTAKVGQAMWDFVHNQAATDPTEVPDYPLTGGVDVPLAAAGKKPFWCKLFRSAPGCH